MPKKLTKKEQQNARAVAMTKKLTDYSCFKVVKKLEGNENLDPVDVTKKVTDNSSSGCQPLPAQALQSSNILSNTLILAKTEGAVGGIGASLPLCQNISEESFYSLNFNDLSTTFEKMLLNDPEYEEFGQNYDHEDEEKENEEDEVENEDDESDDVQEYLTDSQIADIIKENRVSIEKGMFACSVKECSYELKSQSRPKYMVRLTKLHLSHHKLETPYACTFPNCNKAFKHPDHLLKHQSRKHQSCVIDCAMPGCAKTFQEKRNMKYHLLTCIQPDFLFCQECKYRLHRIESVNSHWTSEIHQRNCDILQQRGIPASSPPMVNFYDEEGWRNESEVLSRLKVRRVKGTKAERKKYTQFVTKN